jgi:hypothetical protein
LGTRIIILNIIGWWNSHKIPLVHERKKGLWLEGRIFTSFHWSKEINSKRDQVIGSLEFEILLLVWCEMLYVLQEECVRGEKLVEFVWMCVAHEHNDVCKQKGHGRRLSVEGRGNYNFMEYYRWTSFWTFY